MTAVSWSVLVRELGDRIAELTLREAGELSAYLREVHHIEAASRPVKPIEPLPPILPPVVPTECEVRLDGYDSPRKLMLIKLLREFLPALGLREAKEAVEGSPRIVAGPLPRAEAERMRQRLEEVGARVTLVA